MMKNDTNLSPIPPIFEFSIMTSNIAIMFTKEPDLLDIEKARDMLNGLTDDIINNEILDNIIGSRL